MKKEMRYLVPGNYMADPAVHVFNDRVYIYPSHDWESGIRENDNGDHFNMKDYHVFSTDDIMNGEIKEPRSSSSGRGHSLGRPPTVGLRRSSERWKILYVFPSKRPK